MLLRLLAAISGLIPVTGFAQPSQVNSSIPLIQPLTGGASSILTTTGSDLPLFQYITEGLVWLHEVAIGIVILWMVFAGMQIMISGNDQGKRTEAKEHVIAAIIGLLMLFLLGFILSVLNSSFFLQ